MTNNLDRSSSLSSPFYSGNVTFGGSNALGSYKRSRSLFNSTNDFQLKVPRRTCVQVKPSNSETLDASGMSQTAKRILEAMEYFSSPISDAKKIPIKSASDLGPTISGKKRLRDDDTAGPTTRVGLRHLTRELAVPTVPDMLKLRRRQKLQDTTVAARKIVSAMSGPPPAPSSAFATTTYQLPTIQDESSKFHGKLRTKSKTTERTTKRNLEEETPAPTVNLPRITLPITSLPNFAPLPQYTKPATNQTTESKISTNDLEKSSFKFASPIKMSESSWNLKSINNFSFSKPINAEIASPNKAENSELNHPEKTLSLDSNATITSGNSYDEKSPNFMWSGSSTAPRLKAKTKQPKETTLYSTTSELKTGSVMDILGKSNKVDVKRSSVDRWECAECYIKNDAKDKICVACKATKPSAIKTQAEWSPKPFVTEANKVNESAKSNDTFGSQFKLANNQWECESCMVRNNQSTLKCVSCTTPKPTPKASLPIPTASISTSPAIKSDLMDKFKPAEGSWECPGCMLRNPPNVVTCPCCNAAKPSAIKINPKKLTTDANPEKTSNENSSVMDKFKPASNTWECSSCMVRNNESANSCVCCSNPKPGVPAKSTATPVTSGWGDKFKKPEGTWTCDSCMVSNKSDVTECVACGGLKPGAQPKPVTASSQFSFGIPTTGQTFKFGIDKADVKSKSDTTLASSNGFTFGQNSKDADVVGKQTSQFTFGIPKKSEDLEKSEIAAPPSGFTFSSAKNANVGGFKFDATKSNTEANSTKSTKDENTFSFGLPKIVSESQDVTIDKETSFGNVGKPTFVFGMPATDSNEIGKTSASGSSVEITEIPVVTGKSSTPSEPAQARSPFTFAEGKSQLTSSSGFGQTSSMTPSVSSTFAIGGATQTESQGEKKSINFGNAVASSTSSFGIAGGSDEKNKGKESASFSMIENKATSGFFSIQGTNPTSAFGTVENKTNFGDKSGNSTIFNSQSSASPAFGASSTPAAATPSLFGSTTTQVFGNSAASSFGSAAPATETTSMFASAKANATSPSANSGLFTFGGSSQATSSTPSTGGFSFNANVTPAATAVAKPAIFTFGGSTAGANQQSNELFGGSGASNVGTFGGNSANVNSTQSAFTFNAPAKQEPPAFGQASSSVTNMFGAQPNTQGIGQQQNTAGNFANNSAGSTTGFSLGAFSNQPSTNFNFAGAMVRFWRIFFSIRRRREVCGEMLQS